MQVTPAEKEDSPWIRLWNGVEQVPLLLPALALLVGTLVSAWARHAQLWPILAALTVLFVSALALYLRCCRRTSFLLCLAGYVVAGWLWNQGSFLARQEELARLDPLVEAGTAPEWLGFLYRDPEVAADKTTLHLHLDSAKYLDRTIPLRARARVSVFPGEGQQVTFTFGEPVYGDLLRIRAPLSRPRNFRNPGMFDYVAHLERNGILLIGSLKSPLQVTKLGSGAGNPVLRAAYSIRRSFRRYLIQQFSGHEGGENSSAILEALLFGERSRLRPAIEKLFQETGTYHVFVVSGFNTTVIALFLVWTLRKARVPALFVVLVTGVSLAGYALMTELGSPVVRASILSFVVLLADVLYRKSNLLNSLALAALVTLILWPELATDAGFQLTYLACLAIVLMGLPAVRRTVDPFRSALGCLFGENPLLVRRDVFSRAARRLRFELELAVEWILDRNGCGRARLKVFFAGQVRRLADVAYYLAGLLLVSIAIHIALLPLMAYLFNRANVGAFLANLLVVPAMTLLLLATLFVGGLLWLLGWTWSPWVVLCSWILEHLLAWLEEAATAGVWHWRVATPPWQWVLGYLTVGTLAVLPIRRQFRWTAAGLALLMLPTFWWNPFAVVRRLPGQMEIYFLDVGQGDAIFILSPDGRTLLVDAGGLIGSGYSEDPPPAEGPQASKFDIGEDVVSRFLWTLRVRRLDYVVLTHPHQDHAGGLAAVIENFPVGSLLGPEPAGKLEAQLPQLSQTTSRHHLQWQGLLRDARWRLGLATVEVLNPPQTILGPFGHINNRSVVLRVRWEDHAVLLAGDVERPAERDLARDCTALKSDILKVAHHGSATSTIDAFLECVRPEWAVISAGWNSRFLHPSGEVLQRLRGRAVQVMETSQQGAIYAAVSSVGVFVRPALQ